MRTTITLSVDHTMKEKLDTLAYSLSKSRSEIVSELVGELWTKIVGTEEER